MKIISIHECDKESINCFNCGNNDLNRYFIKHAYENDKNNIGKTFVLIEDKTIIGFYTLSAASIEYNDLSLEYKNKLPKYPIPCMRLARFAIDIKYQNKNYGHYLIKDAFLKTVLISKNTGVLFLIVDSKPNSKKFYLKFGFKSLPLKDSTLILEIETIRNAISY